MATIGINVGHGHSSRGYDPGAVGYDGTHEYEWCKALYAELIPLLDCRHVAIQGDYAALPTLANARNVDYFISLHLNAAASRDAHGTEVLYWHGSPRGQQLARQLAAAISTCLGTRLRYDGTGARPLQAHDRGAYLLRATHMPAIILEPFFLSNTHELAACTPKRAELARAIASVLNTL